MQAGDLGQIATDLPYPAHIPAGWRDQGARSPAGGGCATPWGNHRPTYHCTQRQRRRRSQALRLARPQDVLPRMTPNGHRRTLFFAGKGGVAKTVASCASAVWLARQGTKRCY